MARLGKTICNPPRAGKEIDRATQRCSNTVLEHLFRPRPDPAETLALRIARDEAIRALHAEGLSIRKIAQELFVGVATVHRALRPEALQQTAHHKHRLGWLGYDAPDVSLDQTKGLLMQRWCNLARTIRMTNQVLKALSKSQ